MGITYKQSGVDIDAGNESVNRIKNIVKQTFDKYVLTGIGTFGAMYDFGELATQYKHPVLVQSTDSVGTKVMLASKANAYGMIGKDIVAHCCNDILSQGAKPLTFLDYIAAPSIDPARIAEIVSGVAEGCKSAGVSLVGGEIAELSGVYKENEFDLVGCVLGVVEKDKIITGEKIKPSDIVLGFASSGLHTNGYTLARKVLFDISGISINSKEGRALLEPHLNYTKPVFEILNKGIEIKGIAHITGGGFYENIPRILPKDCGVEIQKNSWPVLPVFKTIQKRGNVKEKEMYRTFNMGIGMIIVVSPEDAHKIDGVYKIGKVVKGNKIVVIK